MNEIALSNDLNVIEFEITQHRALASNSIIEIGKRLNHVKEKDLTHGQFMQWVENTLDMSYQTANKYMKVAIEFPNITPARTLGLDNLYEISSLPNKLKEKEVKKIEEGNPSTRQEVRQLKKQIKEKEASFQRLLKDKDEVINKTYDRLRELQTQDPKVIEKEVEKPVVPHDYEYLKSNNKMLNDDLKDYRASAAYYEKQYKELLEQQKEVNEKSRKYDELSDAIAVAEGKLSKYQKKVANSKRILDFVVAGKEFLVGMSGLVYQDFEDISEYEVKEVEFIVDQTRRLIDDVEQKLNRPKIFEGEIIND